MECFNCFEDMTLTYEYKYIKIYKCECKATYKRYENSHENKIHRKKPVKKKRKKKRRR